MGKMFGWIEKKIYRLALYVLTVIICQHYKKYGGLDQMMNGTTLVTVKGKTYLIRYLLKPHYINL